ncbi:hypothetical protein AB0530_000848 [Vibrio parahaemolyticus]
MKQRVFIGESSWDLECYKKFFPGDSETFIHNDYFNESNISNTSKSYRIKIFMKVLKLALISLMRGREIYFSSLNFEVMFVAMIISKYKKSYIFLPNVIGDKQGYNVSFNKLMSAYKSRVFPSDTVTLYNLREFCPVALPDIFTFKVPDKDILDQVTYIVVMPAALSHASTKSSSKSFYEFSMQVAEKLSERYIRVFILPHPRDREYYDSIDNKVSVISKNEIVKLGKNVCYISGHSSLSLNKRYGGDYGVWVNFDGNYSLHPSLVNNKELTIELDYFFQNRL